MELLLLLAAAGVMAVGMGWLWSTPHGRVAMEVSGAILGWFARIVRVAAGFFH